MYLNVGHNGAYSIFFKGYTLCKKFESLRTSVVHPHVKFKSNQAEKVTAGLFSRFDHVIFPIEAGGHFHKISAFLWQKTRFYLIQIQYCV